MACDVFGQKGEIRPKSMWTVLGSFESIFKASESFPEEML